MPGIAATVDVLCTLANLEAQQRLVVSKLYEMEQALRRTSPETISTVSWMRVRSALIDFVVSGQDQAEIISDQLRTLREVLDDCNSGSGDSG